MKKDFVKSWKSSTQPRKQRKYRYNAALHIVGKFLSVNLAKDLRKKYLTRSTRIRKGDKVKVVRGQHKGKTGKIDKVSMKYVKVYVTGIEMLRKDGTKTLIPLEPSNLQILELNLSDKKRMEKNGKTTS